MDDFFWRALAASSGIAIVAGPLGILGALGAVTAQLTFFGILTIVFLGPAVEEITKALGAVVLVELSGTLTDGSEFFARDCLQVVPPGGIVPANFAVEASAPRAYAFMSPWDMNLDSDGFADFVRAYPPGLSVTLTADLMAPDGSKFDHWVVNGVVWRRGVLTITVEVTENMNLEAVYVGPRPADRNPPQGGRSYGISY